MSKVIKSTKNVTYDGYNINISDYYDSEEYLLTILLPENQRFSLSTSVQIFPRRVIGTLTETERQIRQRNENIRAEYAYNEVMKELIHTYRQYLLNG